jgi:hypothetical protein
MTGGYHHQRAIATELYETALRHQTVRLDYRKAANHVTWTRSPKVYHVVDGDRFDDTTGDAWTTSRKKPSARGGRRFTRSPPAKGYGCRDAFAAEAGG